MKCKKCGHEMAKNGRDRYGRQKYICRKCKVNASGLKVESGNIEQPTKRLGINEEQFRAKHDLSFIINNKLNDLPEGIFYTYQEFITLAGLRGKNGYADVLKDTNFDKFRGKAQGVTYYSNPKTIQKYRDNGQLITNY